MREDEPMTGAGGQGAGALFADPDVTVGSAQASPGRSPARGGAALSLRGVSIAYGARRVLEDVSLDVEPGSFVAIVGRSGCGKSTLLRLAAGLEQASAGTLSIDRGTLTAHSDALRIMFQEPRLLPWKRVLDNVALGLRGEGVRERALEALDSVGLSARAEDWPGVLSGGQRQRVALARALVHTPRLLLLDEPLGALDALTRIEMHRLIERLWRRHGFTALLVTHDVSEAIALADRVLLLEDRHVALDVDVRLARPRSAGDPRVAAEAQRLLDRVLGAA